MKAIVVALMVVIAIPAFGQVHRSARKTLVVAQGESSIPVLAGPSGTCDQMGSLMPCASVRQLCEKVDAQGILWAKVEIKGWVIVREGGKRSLRRLMTRDHEWTVTGAGDCPPVICCCQTGAPLCQLDPCAVVAKESGGLPDRGRICVSMEGWVVKRCSQGWHFREL